MKILYENAYVVESDPKPYYAVIPIMNEQSGTCTLKLMGDRTGDISAEVELFTLISSPDFDYPDAGDTRTFHWSSLEDKCYFGVDYDIYDNFDQNDIPSDFYVSFWV